MKLVMTILVKNEADIIETNIRFHADQGVDSFLVMDNASDDNTPDILEKLSKDFDVHVVHNPSTDYQQEKWMTELAIKARKELGADLVISNDADEFWSAANSTSLKDALDSKDSVVTVPRYNFIQSREAMNADDPFWQCMNKVVSPIVYSRDDQLHRMGLAMPLVKISPKVIVNPKGLIKIKGGNHRAKHLRRWADRNTDKIEVHHYPIRNYQQFEKNIKNRKRLLESDPDTRMGVHYKRWVDLLNQNQLASEFDDMSLSVGEIATLERVGVVNKQKSTPLQLWAEKGLIVR